MEITAISGVFHIENLLVFYTIRGCRNYYVQRRLRYPLSVKLRLNQIIVTFQNTGLSLQMRGVTHCG